MKNNKAPNNNKENKEFDINNSSILQKLPMLIRNDGLIETLKYLVNKGEEEIYSYLISYIEEKNKGIVEVIKQNVQSDYSFIEQKICEFPEHCESPYQYLKKYLSEQKRKIHIKEDNSKNKKVRDRKNYDRLVKKIGQEEALYIGFIETINEKRKINTIEYIRITKEIYDLSIRIAFTYKFLEKMEIKRQILPEVEVKDSIDSKNIFEEERDYLYKKFCIQEECDNTITVEANTVGNMVVGLGEVSVKEVSMKKHHLFNVPYIPASAIKGVFRHYCYERCSSDNTKKRYEQWFGTEDKQGSLIFLDAYPEDYKIKKDVMTPHYQKYYSDENESKRPTDDDNLIPVKFDVIYNTKFRFVICIKENDIEQMEKDQVEKEFIECLQEKSFGAKSSIGYGGLKL